MQKGPHYNTKMTYWICWWAVYSRGAPRSPLWGSLVPATPRSRPSSPSPPIDTCCFASSPCSNAACLRPGAYRSKPPLILLGVSWVCDRRGLGMPWQVVDWWRYIGGSEQQVVVTQRRLIQQVNNLQDANLRFRAPSSRSGAAAAKDVRRPRRRRRRPIQALLPDPARPPLSLDTRKRPLGSPPLYGFYQGSQADVALGL